MQSPEKSELSRLQRFVSRSVFAIIMKECNKLANDKKN